MSYGATFDPTQDGLRLETQLEAVRCLMARGETWLSLSEIADQASARVGNICSEASVSARLRDLRKPRHGGRRRHEGGGLHEYRMWTSRPQTSRSLFGDDGRGTLDALR